MKPEFNLAGLTENENTERERLLELQKSKTRFFSQEEFDRLKLLSRKAFIQMGKDNGLTIAKAWEDDFINSVQRIK